MYKIGDKITENSIFVNIKIILYHKKKYQNKNIKKINYIFIF